MGRSELGSQGPGFNLTSPLTKGENFISLLASIFLPPNASKYIFSLTLTNQTKPNTPNSIRKTKYGFLVPFNRGKVEQFVHGHEVSKWWLKTGTWLFSFGSSPMHTPSVSHLWKQVWFSKHSHIPYYLSLKMNQMKKTVDVFRVGPTD